MPNPHAPEGLPELPAPEATLHVQWFRDNPTMRNTDLSEAQDFGPGSHALYTAAQMREYARTALAGSGAGWVSVSERLPEAGQRVMVWVTGPECCTFVYLDAQGDWRHCHDCSWIPHAPDYWHPQPTPPPSKEKE